MTALSASTTRKRRGPPAQGSSFAYPVKAGQAVWAGGLVCANSSNEIMPIGQQGTATVGFAGLAVGSYDNTAGAAAAGSVECVRGTFALPLSTDASKLGADVYATDDATPTLTAGSNVKIGNVAGIEAGTTWIRLLGS